MKLAGIADYRVDIAKVVKFGDGHGAHNHLLDLRRGGVSGCQEGVGEYCSC